MKSSFSFPQAGVGAAIAFAIWVIGWFAEGTRACHDPRWGLFGVVFMSVIGFPVWAALAVIAGAAAGYTAPESRRTALLVAAALLAAVVTVILIATVPQVGPCRMDM